MADMMAIISKAVFEKAAGKAPTVGTQLKMDRYVSVNKNLERLAEGGTLYLVTVRPPDEALWLVAILENPKFDGQQWVAKTCATPITDISDLKSKLEFESGKGLSTAKGALGMSLQTPRSVTTADARMLDHAVGVEPIEAAAPKTGREGFPAAPEGAVGTGAGNRRALLLQAVISEPDNRDARQVYADALVATNDPRGDFIVLDHALDGPLSIRKRESSKRQREALFAANRETWWPYKAVRLRTHRGFVEAISGTLKAINAAAAIFDAEPITEVEVRGLSGVDGVERLLAAAWLPRVHHLILRGKIKDEGFGALVQSPALSKLRALNVTGNKLGPDAMALLATNLPSCRSLVLTNNKLEDAGITGLVKWKHLGQLETLYLGNCGLTGTGVARLLDGSPLVKLIKLALTDN
ncbi:MAG: hypothetical protein H0V17_12990, partial [Deltaproteobacteria bacterium]|nr:hypothetical protein [Deltaproteobacteria bacterium]